ncbi:MAG: hypothetical protein MZV70_51345 [Desulfobacterales bacterium]|nr:hypothetical protein [Desulfobacterales bacterium]
MNTASRFEGLQQALRHADHHRAEHPGAGERAVRGPRPSTSSPSRERQGGPDLRADGRGGRRPMSASRAIAALAVNGAGASTCDRRWDEARECCTEGSWSSTTDDEPATHPDGSAAGACGRPRRPATGTASTASRANNRF